MKNKDKTEFWKALAIVLLFLSIFMIIKDVSEEEKTCPSPECNYKCISPNATLFMRCINDCIPIQVINNLSKEYCDYCFNVG